MNAGQQSLEDVTLSEQWEVRFAPVVPTVSDASLARTWAATAREITTSHRSMPGLLSGWPLRVGIASAVFAGALVSPFGQDAVAAAADIVGEVLRADVPAPARPGDVIIPAADPGIDEIPAP